MEQVADWEVGTGRADQESTWTKTKQMVVTLPDGKTRTIGISQVNLFPRLKLGFGSLARDPTLRDRAGFIT